MEQLLNTCEIAKIECLNNIHRIYPFTSKRYYSTFQPMIKFYSCLYNECSSLLRVGSGKSRGHILQLICALQANSLLFISLLWVTNHPSD